MKAPPTRREPTVVEATPKARVALAYGTFWEANMKIVHLLAAVSLGALSLAGCQPPTASTDAPAAEAPAAEAPVSTATLPCGVIAQRDWTAQGTATTLTIAGKIDLPRAGYGVSLARTDAEGVLALELRPPAASADMITEHSVNYYGPISTALRSVQITCDGTELAQVQVTN